MDSKKKKEKIITREVAIETFVFPNLFKHKQLYIFHFMEKTQGVSFAKKV